MGVKKREKNFSKNTRLGYPKNVGKNLLKKVRKHVFYKHTNIVTKKMGEKKREKKIFPETHVFRELKTMEKNRLEKVRIHVF